MTLREKLDRFLERHDRIIYLALFGVGLLARLSVLNAAPLNEKEALEAWGAWHLLRGEPIASGSPLFASFTAGLLFLAGPSHWAPRLLPALAGSLIVFLPLLGRSTRGSLEAVLAAFLLALSPSFLIVSSMAGGISSGLVTAAFCVFYFRSREWNPLWCGVVSALAVASGPIGWSGLAIALLATLAERIFYGKKIPKAGKQAIHPARASFEQLLHSTTGLGGLFLCFIAASTGLFFFLRGFGAYAAGLSSWLAAFLSGFPKVVEFFLLLVAYEPVALLFGVAGIIFCLRNLSSEDDRFLVAFSSVAVLWVFLRPSAFPEETVWVTLPLILLAARALRAAVESPVLAGRPVSLAIQTVLIALLVVYSVLNLSASRVGDSRLHLGLAAAGLAASFCVGPMFSEDWKLGLRQSWKAIAFAWLALLILFQTGAGWNATHGGRLSANELWWPDAATAEIVRLRLTMAEYSGSPAGNGNELIAVIEVPEDSALGWELLAYKGSAVYGEPGMLDTPEMIVTPEIDVEGGVIPPRQPAAYRGRAFAVTERRTWFGLPPDPIGWLLYRMGPVERESVILWVRTDILEPDRAPGS